MTLFTRRFALVLGGAALLLGSCGQGAGTAPGAPRSEITFSILSAESQASSGPLWQPLLDDMSEALGVEVTTRFGSNYNVLIEAMRFDQSQVGWFSAKPALEAVERAQGEVIARTVDLEGADSYRSTLIVRKGSGITLDDVLACGQRYDFGIGDAQSTSGTLAPMTFLFNPRGVVPSECFKTVRSANHQANAFAVATGVVDVATSNSVNTVFLKRENPQIAEQIEDIWQSPPIPESGIVVREDLDPALKEKIRRFFLEYGQGEGPEAERQREVLRGLNYSQFRAADDSYLDPVREMVADQALSDARSRNDAAAVAEAEADLAALRARREGAALSAATPAAADPAAVPAAPTRSAGAWAYDLLLWGGLLILLVISFETVDMERLPLLLQNSQNMQAYGQGLLNPDWNNWQLLVEQMWLTVQIALWGTFLAVFLAVPLSLCAARNVAPSWLVWPVRRVMDLLRSIPDLVIATLFIVAVGLGPLAGVLALTLNTGGVLAKLFSEAVESIDRGPVEGVRATGAGGLHEIIWGVIPQVAPLWTSFALYRFESNSRAATVLGLIGVGGIGQVLFESMQTFDSARVAAIAIVIVVAVTLIDMLSQAIRKRLL